MADAGDQTNSPDVQGDVAPAKTENKNVAPRSSCTDSQTQSAPSSPAHGVKAKIDVLLKAAGDAPIMKKKKWSVERTKSVGWIIEFIRRFLKLETADCLFLYVNQAFAPSPDVEVGKLYDCFESDGKLIMHYCRSQAWG